MAGKVWLVGAGPSDIGLLTLKGKEVLEQAQVVVYDALVGPGILSLIPPEAEKINAGKRSSNHLLRQEQTNRLLQRGAFLFYLQGRRAQRNIRAAFHTCVEAADALQAGDEAVFVQKLTDSYRLILERARQRFIEAGLPGAAEIVLP